MALSVHLINFLRSRELIVCLVGLAHFWLVIRDDRLLLGLLFLLFARFNLSRSIAFIRGGFELR